MNKLSIFKLLTIICLIGLVKADCPDYLYDCYDQNGYTLGKICRGSCWKFFSCAPCHSIKYYVDECRLSFPNSRSYGQTDFTCKET